MAEETRVGRVLAARCMASEICLGIAKPVTETSRNNHQMQMQGQKKAMNALEPSASSAHNIKDIMMHSPHAYPSHSKCHFQNLVLRNSHIDSHCPSHNTFS